MESVAIAGRNAIKAFSGRYYRVGSISQITKHNIAGSVVDYAHGAVKIPLTLVMELPANEYGFQPPTHKINPLGMESWQGIREMCKKAYGLRAKIVKEEVEKSLVPQQLQVEKTESNVTLIKDDSSMKLQKNFKTPTLSSSHKDKVLENSKPQFAIKSKSSKNRQNSLIGGHISSIFDVKS